MHPVAKRCLIWAAVLVVVGSLLFQYGADLTWWFQDLVGANAEIALHVHAFITNLLHNFALPLAAGLVTAGIVIQTLAPRPKAEAGED
ncbi:hypothetical protein ACNI3K_05725 [Demequina sp. SO4-13]|uniref:hypothetical protein n=1 Tax=Demequina sp. SO4-13 TaxID=3401027 RepID=UPI003AF4205A